MVVGQVAGSNDLDAGFGQSALTVAFHEGHALFASGNEDEDRLGLGILDALDKGREFRIA